MATDQYRDQVRLLLDVLPLVMAEPVFALKGGTAIKLFEWDLPRLSVDIDLTYLPVHGRAASLRAIGEALARIKTEIEPTIWGDSRVYRKMINCTKLAIHRQGLPLHQALWPSTHHKSDEAIRCGLNAAHR